MWDEQYLYRWLNFRFQLTGYYWLITILKAPYQLVCSVSSATIVIYWVFENESIKICGSQPLKNDMVYLSRPYIFNFFKGCLPQILLGPFLNFLSHLYAKIYRFLSPVSHFSYCFLLANFPSTVPICFYFSFLNYVSKKLLFLHNP